MPKITLNVDSKTISLAKKLARFNQTSVSDMFCRYIKSLAVGDKTEVELGPLTQEMTGIIKLPRGKSGRDVLTEALMDKQRVKGSADSAWGPLLAASGQFTEDFMADRNQPKKPEHRKSL